MAELALLNKYEENRTDMEGQDEKILEFGQGKAGEIFLLSIIGEVEGHDCLAQNVKSTKYEHLLPKLAMVEYDDSIKGLLVLINTIGGDVECGLAIAEMIASISKPTVSLVLGGSHSIGVPLATATDYSFIVPTATMIVHPVRLSGTVIGAKATYDYFNQIQSRIISFVCRHSKVKEERMEKLMMNTEMLAKDVGTVLVGEEAVEEGIICQVGGIKDAYKKIQSMIKKKTQKSNSVV